MSAQTELTDNEFVPFLRNLGVETYKKSFEWMMNDPDFAGILLWIYNNLDHNNALNSREEYRYAELEKKGQLLTPEVLESTIMSIQQKHPNISLPGEKEALEDVKLDIEMQKERLHCLEDQEKHLKELISKNERIKEELNIEIIKLECTCRQFTQDEKVASEQCLESAQQVEDITDTVVDQVARTLDVYSNCHVDSDLAKKFLNFGPLDAYKQSQALFCSHFDLYTSKKFKGQHDLSDEDLKSALIEAKSMEERLSQAACAYIDAKVELAGEQAKLSLVENYSDVHPSQITELSIEAQTALDLLTQEESILEQQVQVAVKDLVTSRTRLAVDTTVKSALVVREQILADLTHLLEVCHQALALDKILYCGLRHELRQAEDLLQFAAQLREYVVDEDDAVASRIDSMNAICAEQKQCEEKLQSSDSLLRFLANVLGTTHTDPTVLVKVYNDFVAKVKTLRGDVIDGYRKKEQDLNEFKSSLAPLRAQLSSGPARRPTHRDVTAAALAHSLRAKVDSVEKMVVHLGGLFTAAKNSDKHNLRKLWQWFLTDEARFLAAMKGMTRG